MSAPLLPRNRVHPTWHAVIATCERANREATNEGRKEPCVLWWRWRFDRKAGAR